MHAQRSLAVALFAAGLLVLGASACGDDAPEGAAGTPGPGGGSGGAAGGSGGTGGGSAGHGGAAGGSGGEGGSQQGVIPDPTDPLGADRDYDCDGLSDAEEYGITYPGGGSTDPLLRDSDGDGIDDGVEAGRTSSIDPRCGDFAGDADPTTTTNPASADSDGDLIPDGAEEKNGNGRVDAGECDPTSADSDGDGIPDATEDLDHDGVVDPTETDACARDTDSDGIPDGIEDANRDGIRQAAETDARNPDTDGDGRLDGDEDRNWNHLVDAGETDPLVPQVDSDRDGLLDEEEAQLGTDPNNADSDGDGLPDGVEERNGDGVISADETNPRSADTDCDGLSDGAEDANGNGATDLGETDPRFADTDGDLLPDGRELGATGSPDPACAFTGDSNPATVTNPLLADSDGDGVNDGIEDVNRNGAVDAADRDYDPANRDSDGDVLSDGDEDVNRNHRVDSGETDPLVPDVDSDGDGITDPVENGVTHTDPANRDTDGDGLSDGQEDGNRDGVVNLGETSALSPDSDCDGLTDGEEDANLSGGFDAGETDPTYPDTDGDGLLDGQELGRTSSPEPACAGIFVPDLDPGTTTTATNNDSDADGIQDGAEDANHNGRVDPAELDPRNGGDAGPTVVAACGTANLAPVVLADDSQADLILAHRPAYSEVTTVTNAGGRRVGKQVFAPAGGGYPNAMAGFAVIKTPAGDALAEEGAGRAAFSGTSPVVQQFVTWDGYPAVRALYDVPGNGDLKTKANNLVTALIPGAGGLLAGNAGVNGPFKLLVEYVVRSPNRAVVVGSLIRASDYTGDNLWRLDDLANGSALAQAGDDTNVGCDRFGTTAYSPVDFLWVVDNSGSMGNDQAALTAAATEMGNQLTASTLDWRIATVYTDTDRTSTIRNFTTSIAQFQTDASPGTNGSGTERGFAPVQTALTNRFLPVAAGQATKIRPGATLVVVFVSDEIEQSAGTEQSWISYFTDWDPNTPGNQTAFLAGLIYPGNTGLRYRNVINSLNGIEGDLSNLATIGPTINAMMNAVIGQTSPYVLSQPPISATIKVAMEPTALVPAAGPGCDAANIPRSRSNGFDYDGIGNRIAFFGDCRATPASLGATIAVSYRYWIDRSPDPDGTPEGCGGCILPLICNPVSQQCECPADCGGGAPGPNFVCDTGSCTFTCPADCGGGCGGRQSCDAGSCACACPADCGAPSPGPGFACDTSSCSFTCDESCGGQPQPTPGHACNRATCQWECPDDCGQPMNPDQTTVCDPTSCTMVCPADCGGQCQGNFACNVGSCACECRQNVSCQPGFVFDQASCACVCDTAGISCTNLREPDPASCGCICPVDCGGCDGTCNLSACTCTNFG